MLRKIELFIFLYVSLVSTLNISLILTGESRVDSYVAANILAYYVSYAIIRPTPSNSLALRSLNAILIILFIALSIMRIYEVIVR